MRIVLAREKQFGNCVIEELCGLKVDAEAEVFEIFPMFRHFDKGIVLS
jgi:hypothetical protein